jgi:hypothetical protein
MRSSTRLAAMFAAIADQVDNRNKKAIVFALNSWEQQLFSVLLNIMGYKSVDYLATMKNDHKEDIRYQVFPKPVGSRC